uniref:Retrotransposon gag domain-containing protein n=1 Tax=Brassica oleracea var. oleracea TaxID=109376 RepID=A0A0D3B7J7_BRAOL
MLGPYSGITVDRQSFISSTASCCEADWPLFTILDKKGQDDNAWKSYDSEGDENPFAPLRHQHNRRVNRRNANNSNSDEEQDDNAWKSCFKLDFREFNGSTIAEELLGLFVTVKEILEFKQFPLDHCVPLVAIHFRDRAAAWWSQDKTTRSRLRKSKIMSRDRIKQEMKKIFVPYNYDQLMFQNSKVCGKGLDPLTIMQHNFKMINRVKVCDTEEQLTM